MAEVIPFRGVRYSDSDLSQHVAPPYDVVSPSKQTEIVGRNRQSVLLVDNPASGIEDEFRRQASYATAAGILELWLGVGVLARDEEPSLYAVAHEFDLPDGSGRVTRNGLIGLLPAKPWGEDSVRPHEHTFRGPKEDRLALMRASEAQTSPIFAMWKSADGLDEILQKVMQSDNAAQAEFAGEFGPETVRLWRIDDKTALGRIESSLSPASLYMVDGHHRYETAVAFAEEWRASHPGEQAHVLAYLSSSSDPALIVLPTHRLIRFSGDDHPTFSEVTKKLGRGWTSKKVSPSDGLAKLQADAGKSHQFLVASSDGAFLLCRTRAKTSSPVESLDVQILHDELLGLLGVDDTATVTFERDPQAALAEVENGTADIAILIAAPQVNDVIQVADAGESMPQKSTYFYPKVPTGLVIYKLAE